MATETKAPSSQGAPSATGESSEKMESAPRTFTEEEHLKAVSDERAAAGRLKADLEKAVKERDSLKARLAEVSAEVEGARAAQTETEAKIEVLQAELVTLADENATASEIAKIRKRLGDAELQLRKDIKASKDAVAAEKEALRQEREKWATTVSEAQAMRFEVDLFEIAEEHEGGDSARLKMLAEKAGKTKREDIEEIADILWAKKGQAVTEKRPLIVADSGVSNGGGVNYDTLNPRQKIEWGLQQAHKQ